MCGICGFISKTSDTLDNLIKMNDLLIHRGPDDHGEEIYQIQDGRYVGFAQRRLSMLDLSFRGRQPMHSADKRISIVFNGEIYNYNELREQLNDYPFVSSCDTEVIIAAYIKWGIDFVNKINGMFAIALLDREKADIYLIRDRIGKKPLYYYHDSEKNIVFGSELKAVCQSAFVHPELNKEVIGRYIYKGYITAPDTIYKNIYKLEPGGILKITESQIIHRKYWDVARQYNMLKKSPVLDYEQAKYELKDLLRQAVKRRMISDVPLGAFLSGGYDSSLMCAIASELLPTPLKTFSVGFNEDKFNEAVYAKQVAEELGTDHTEIYLSEEDALGIIESIPRYYDEPFADSSQIPTMLVSQLAKTQVSVALSGDGGDELFGGYKIYAHMYEAEKRKHMGKILYMLGKIPGVKQSSMWKKRKFVWRIVSDGNDAETRTQRGGANVGVINDLLLDGGDRLYFEFESRYQEKRYDVTRMLLDMDTFLPDDILTKVDRASMRYALECRCPILDKEVIEYSFRLPIDFKSGHGNQKRILKDITYEYLPRGIMDRPKAGFSIPLDKWLRTALKEKIMDWTDREYLVRQGIFNADVLIGLIDSYMKTGDLGPNTGQNYSAYIWAYFMFQQWYDKYQGCYIC